MNEKLKQMESFLKEEKPIFICREDYIDADSFEKLKDMYKKYSKTKFKDCFEKVKDLKNKDKEDNYFSFEFRCSNCGNIYKLKDSKTKLFYYIETTREKDLLCMNCVMEENKKFLERRKKEQEEERIYKENLETYYKNYWLNPEINLEKEIYLKPWKARDEIKNIINYLGRDVIKYYSNSLDYKDYLKTPYWKLVSSLSKRKANYKCQLCGSDYNLNVHHRSYKNRGIEIYNMEDLIVLCFDCHQKFHDIDTLGD